MKTMSFQIQYNSIIIKYFVTKNASIFYFLFSLLDSFFKNKFSIYIFFLNSFFLVLNYFLL
jgi:hypothetical protein